MRLPLDSNAVIRWMIAPISLPDVVHTAIKAGANDAFVSAATAYELEFKQSLGKLPFGLPPNWRGDLARVGFSWLSISDVHASRAANLTLHHRDPWDRVNIGQAVEEGLTLVSSDRAFRQYGVAVLW